MSVEKFKVSKCDGSEYLAHVVEQRDFIKKYPHNDARSLYFCLSDDSNESTFYIEWSEGFSYTVKLCYFNKDEAYKQLTFSLKRTVKELSQKIQNFKTAMRELL